MSRRIERRCEDGEKMRSQNFVTRFNQACERNIDLENFEYLTVMGKQAKTGNTNRIGRQRAAKSTVKST